ncbi:MAG: SDR family oxidoreductase [Alphaproteobacteria bacterium]|nr:SDR family oxidoreductase [Alphaproteobacteria bacterium]
MRLKGKVAVITGAARGIGLAIAQRFAKEGATVVMADILEKEGKAAAKKIGKKAHFVACDAGSKSAVDNLVKATVSVHRRIDIMVANAGIVRAANFVDITEDDWDAVMRVNLKGVFLAGQAAARQMIKQGKGGAIINMSSVNAVLAIPNIVPYVAAKGGVNQLTRAMSVGLAAHGIRVNAIGPGTILTEIAKSVLTDTAARHKIMSRTPLGRLGKPDEVAGVAVFLASDDSSYITGHTIYPDGGRMALNYTVPVKE